MIHTRTFLTDIFRAWGFESGGDYLRTVLGVKSLTATVTPLALKISFLLGGFGLSFWSTWIWQPPEASFLVLGMNLVNAWYGYQVAKKVKGERFSRLKFQKTASVMVSDILAMSMMHIAIKHYPYYETGRHVLFGYLFGYKLTSIFNHWVMLKLQSGSLVTYFRQWMLTMLASRMGVELVDSMQKAPADPAAELLPAPLPSPPADAAPAPDPASHS